jgi:predicted  nucleic acid-binding Zn-ribbon protein
MCGHSISNKAVELNEMERAIMAAKELSSKAEKSLEAQTQLLEGAQKRVSVLEKANATLSSELAKAQEELSQVKDTVLQL